MKIDVDISRIREKTLRLVSTENEQKFRQLFDSELYLDLIENPEDYLAEGVNAHFQEYL